MRGICRCRDWPPEGLARGRGRSPDCRVAGALARGGVLQVGQRLAARVANVVIVQVEPQRGEGGDVLQRGQRTRAAGPELVGPEVGAWAAGTRRALGNSAVPRGGGPSEKKQQIMAVPIMNLLN